MSTFQFAYKHIHKYAILASRKTRQTITTHQPPSSPTHLLALRREDERRHSNASPPPFRAYFSSYSLSRSERQTNATTTTTTTPTGRYHSLESCKPVDLPPWKSPQPPPARVTGHPQRSLPRVSSAASSATPPLNPRVQANSRQDRQSDAMISAKACKGKPNLADTRMLSGLRSRGEGAMSIPLGPPSHRTPRTELHSSPSGWGPTSSIILHQ